MKEYSVIKHKWLYPLSFLYGMGVSVRNKFFDWNILKSKSYEIPVISVGNLSVGGTGKTPHTEYLIELLQKEYQVAVLSRGYKRKTSGFLLSDSKSSAKSIGDEPFQIKCKYPDIRVAVDENRCRGIEKLMSLKDPEVDVIVLDDAFQHRYVEPGISILLTDFHRLFCDDALMPTGRLRESISGKARAQIVIVTKCPDDMKPIDFNIISKRLELYPYQKLFFSKFNYKELRPVFKDSGPSSRALDTIQEDEEILLVTGIASPAVLVHELKKRTSHIHVLSYADHHSFSDKDIKQIADRFKAIKSGKKMIVTTEKDATRLLGNALVTEEVKKSLYALPIKVDILQGQKSILNQNVIEYVRKNKRNRKLSQRENAHKS